MADQPERVRTRRFNLLSVAVSLVVLVTFVGSLATLAAALYGRSLSDARSVASALQHYALRAVTTGEMLSERAAEAVLARGTLDGLERDTAVRDLLVQLVRRLPSGSGMAVVDRDGDVVAFDGGLPAQPVNLSDRAWFAAHTQDGADLVISEALLSRVTGRIMFIMTRAVRTPDGRLIGIINLGIPAGSLIGPQALPQYGDGVVLTLLKPDGSVLARSDFPIGLLGKKLIPPRAWATADSVAGIVRARAVDGRIAIEAATADPQYGLIAQASIPAAQVFRPLLFAFVIGLPVVLAMLAGILALARSLLRQQRLLAQTSARLQAVLEASHLGAWHLDVPANTSEMNGRWARILGNDPSEVGTSAEEWLSRLHPDERPAVVAAVGDALAGKTQTFHVEHRMRHKDGHWVWVLDSGCVVDRDADGAPLVMTGTLLDISERRDAEQRLRIMMRELDHRAKNLLAVVYSMINLMKSDNVADFKRAILGRVQALGHVHSLLSQSGWEGVDMGRLIATETAAYQSGSGPQICATGPKLTLVPAAAQAVAVVIHEMMTNSAKYGALSADGGAVRLDWSCPPGPGADVALIWSEEGGPPVTAPERKGFGTTLLTTMVQDQLDGRVTADWRAGGAVFTVRFPAHHLRGAPGRT